MVRTNASAPRVAVLTNRIGVFSGNTGGGSAMREKLVAALQREGYDLRLFAAGFHASADVGITDYSPMLLPTWRTLRAIWDVLREADLLDALRQAAAGRMARPAARDLAPQGRRATPPCAAPSSGEAPSPGALPGSRSQRRRATRAAPKGAAHP